MDQILFDRPDLLDQWVNRSNTRLSEDSFQLTEEIVDLYYSPDMNVYWMSHDELTDYNGVPNNDYDGRSDGIYIVGMKDGVYFKICLWWEASIYVSCGLSPPVFISYNDPDRLNRICYLIGTKKKL